MWFRKSTTDIGLLNSSRHEPVTKSRISAVSVALNQTLDLCYENSVSQIIKKQLWTQTDLFISHSIKDINSQSAPWGAGNCLLVQMSNGYFVM